MQDGTTHIYTSEYYDGSSEDENGNNCYTRLLKNLTIINSNLETVKEFTSGPLFEEIEEITVEYAVKTLKVDSISINERDAERDFYNFLFYGVNYDEEDIEPAIANKIANGILIETTYNGTRILYLRHNVVESNHFDWGYQYPSQGWYFEDYDNIQHVSFHYSADEKEEISRYVSDRFSIYMKSDFQLTDANTENWSQVTVSQSLFNNDEKFEFLLPILEPTVTTKYYEYSHTVKTVFGYKKKGIKVVSEDGTVLHEIIASSDIFFTEIVKISDKTYLCITADKVRSFYEIKKNGNNSSINKVRDVRSMNIHPTVAGHNENITITLNDGDNDTERELIVTGVNGQLVERRTIPAGENRLEINAGMLRNGMYNFTLQKKGTFIDNRKVIIK